MHINQQLLIQWGLKLNGVIALLIGFIAVYYGPLEIYVFTFFSENGRFHYPGFGIGSLWFAALVVHDLSYYILAAMLVPVGIGTLKLRRWSLTLSKLYFWLWLGIGITLLFNLCVFAATNLNIANPQRMLLIGGFLLIFFIFLPSLLLWGYTRDTVNQIFKQNDPHRYWTERFPFCLLVLLTLFALYIIIFHLTIFLQSTLPLFGTLLFGRQATYIIASCILILVLLMIGIIQIQRWAWWGSLLFLMLLTSSSIITFWQMRVSDWLNMLSLPTYEMEILAPMTLLQSLYIMPWLLIPLLVTLGLLLYSKKFFTP